MASTESRRKACQNRRVRTPTSGWAARLLLAGVTSLLVTCLSPVEQPVPPDPAERGHLAQLCLDLEIRLGPREANCCSLARDGEWLLRCLTGCPGWKDVLEPAPDAPP